MLLENKSMVLDLNAVGGILAARWHHPADFAHQSRQEARWLEKCVAMLKENNLEALIAIGGDDTLSVAKKLYEKGVQGGRRAEDH